MNTEFENNGYLVYRNFFTEETMLILDTYFDLKYRVLQSDAFLRGEHTANPEDDAQGLILGHDALTESILLVYGEKMSKALNLDLMPTYTYSRIYEKNNYLLPHVDRPSCEVSATCPITIGDNRSSTIYISNFNYNPLIHNGKYKTIEEIKKLGDYTQIDMLPGDILFYKGCERFHWREPLKSDYLIQFFMHTVRRDGQYSEHVFDKRPYMGFPKHSDN